MNNITLKKPSLFEVVLILATFGFLTYVFPRGSLVPVIAAILLFMMIERMK